MNSDIIEEIMKNKEDFVQKDDNITYQITTTENQKITQTKIYLL